MEVSLQPGDIFVIVPIPSFLRKLIWRVLGKVPSREGSKYRVYFSALAVYMGGGEVVLVEDGILVKRAFDTFASRSYHTSIVRVVDSYSISDMLFMIKRALEHQKPASIKALFYNRFLWLFGVNFNGFSKDSVEGTEYVNSLFRAAGVNLFDGKDIDPLVLLICPSIKIVSRKLCEEMRLCLR